jgi:hypothetical protein
MDQIKKIEELFEQARMIGTPVFRVSDQVLDEIADRKTVQLTPFSIMAGLSAAAAVIALVYAVNSWLSMTWTLADYFDPTVLDVLL